jgi:hypothetical protein
LQDIWAISILAAALLAPQSLAQGASPATSVAECRLPLRDAMKTAMAFPVVKREKDPDNGDMIAVLQPSAFTVIGQPALGLNVRRSTEYPSTSFVTRIALDYSAAKATLPRAYGKPKCDAEGTATTYCMMTFPEDSSMGRQRVTLSAEPAEGGGTMLTCMYEKIEG